MKATILLLWLMIMNCNDQGDRDPEPANAPNTKLLAEAANLTTFLKEEAKYNDRIAFLVDMKIHSGKNRFFVYDLHSKRILDQGLIAHGSGSETGGALYFSNVVNSRCTSLGKYKIGKSYNGQFGKAYKLHGLDHTNSKAFERFIVFHKFSQVPYEEQDQPICNSHGCPMVSEKFFGRIEKIIDSSQKDIILSIYY